jgi:hypothetical protein
VVEKTKAWPSAPFSPVSQGGLFWPVELTLEAGITLEPNTGCLPSADVNEGKREEDKPDLAGDFFFFNCWSSFKASFESG